MARYRKFLVALGGFAAQLLIALEWALDTDVVDPEWRPWVVAVVAFLTALGVRQVSNAPSITATVQASTAERLAEILRQRPPGDRGDARPAFLGAIAAFAAALLLIVAGAIAGPADAHDRDGTVRGTWVGVTGDAVACGGWLRVQFSRQRLIAGQWTPELDTDVPARLIAVEGIYGPSSAAPDTSGRVEPLTPILSGGEGTARWRIAGRGTPEQVQVRRLDTGSRSARRAVDGCPRLLSGLAAA